MEFKSEPERNFEAFRPLARHILSSLRDREKADLLDPPGRFPNSRGRRSLVAVALLGCNAMALSGFDFARPYLSLASIQRAEAKGLQLLLDNLTQEQRVQYQCDYSVA
jgi:hypothetical protein